MTESKPKQDILLFRKTVFTMLEAIDTPRSLGLWLRLADNQKPFDFDVNPRDYIDASMYLKDAQALALIKKNPWFFPIDTSLQTAALEKYLETESRCFDTNSYFRYANFRHPCLNEYRPLLERARKIISKILGEFEYGQCDFGPGSTLSLGGKFTNLVNKLRTNPESSPLAYSEVMTVIFDQIPHYAISSGLLIREKGSIRVGDTPCNIINYNRFSTVPKDWKADRGICVEPLGNMLLQKAVGSSIRNKLKKFGLDLDTAPDVHAEYVKLSSLSGCYATLDLASASDTICFSLVKSLLPFDWFDKLNKLRSHYTLLPCGKRIYNEKFSSMGNGFTFELESLIFFALCLAVKDLHGERSNIVSVFGDDIIVTSCLAPKVVKLLEICGFTINHSKSFLSGSFFESCGNDYFNGLPVRPIYLKDIHDKQRIITFYCLANRIRQISYCFSFNSYCDIRFLPAYQAVLRGIPKSLRYYGPAEYGDNVLLSPQSDWKSDYSLGYLRIKAWRRVYRWIKPQQSRPDHVLTCALYGIPSKGVNSRVCDYQVKLAFVSPRCGEISLGWQ